MKTTVIVGRVLVSLIGVTMLILGITFWTGHAFPLIPFHMALGAVLVVSLWFMAGLAIRARISNKLEIVVTIIISIVMPILGVTQRFLLPSANHWIIQVLHLLIGMSAVALGHALGRHIMRERKQAQ